MIRSQLKGTLLGLWLAAAGGLAYGQQVQEITGYVLDANTSEPVSYASVGVPDQATGISANLNGYFNLRLNTTNMDHFLEVSSIGYSRKRIPFSSITWGEEIIIRLDPEITMLREVVIEGRRQTLEDIIASTSRNRKEYLRSTPYLTNVFYRETLQIGDKYAGITEAQGIFYINGYNPKYKNNQNQVMTYDVAQWKHMRRSSYPSESYLRIGKLLKAKDYYLHDGPLKRKNLQKFRYTVVDTSQYQDQAVLVVEFSPLPAYSEEFNYHGRMLIKEDDKALLSIEVEQRGSEPYLAQKEDKQQQSSTFSISFMKFNDQYYLNRSSLMQSYHSPDGPLQYQLEIIGGPFSKQKPKFLNNAQRAVLYSDMLNPAINYDPNFWDAYKFAESEVFKKVEAEISNLDQLFEQNHQLRLVPLPEGMESYEQMVNEQSILEFFMQY
ncbi:MAG: carboxypeptidase-like regulatory domain-containing protein [Cyclobacteriaceae bacterium]|nr:carboxypeptidase-like regulatory domain-containing protein [Cyclobacteriaceae bacterium]